MSHIARIKPISLPFHDGRVSIPQGYTHSYRSAQQTQRDRRISPVGLGTSPHRHIHTLFLSFTISLRVCLSVCLSVCESPSRLSSNPTTTTTSTIAVVFALPCSLPSTPRRRRVMLLHPKMERPRPPCFYRSRQEEKVYCVSRLPRTSNFGR
ncbi:hypothetical protein LY76DRAFT_593086 [Colletotrichum caudatum]|nr:hypothetical protein LY76DRAFT_593086 [Colletotrichum caudatum]